MSGSIEKYLDKMLEFEERGHIEEALILSKKLLETFAEDTEILEEILMEKGKMEFRAGLDKEALLDFIQAYDIRKNEEIYELVLEAYFVLNQENLWKCYQKNIEAMEAYPYYRAEHMKKMRGAVPLWQDEQILVYADIEEKEFGIYKKKELILISPGERVLLEDEMWMDNIKSMEKSCRREYLLPDKKMPFVLLWEEREWALFLQLYDIEELLKLKRCVFLIDEWGLRKWFEEPQTTLPERVYYNRYTAKYEKILEYITEQGALSDEKNVMEMQTYYPAAKEQIRERIQKKRPRILFWTSRFTTAVKYRIRDIMSAAQRMGCETELLIEKSDVHVNFRKDIRRIIADFKPDMIYTANYFRENFEYVNIPEEIVWVTWIQDKLSQSTGNQAIVDNVGKRDIIVSMFISDLQGRHWNMSYKDVLKVPLSANQNIYKKYGLTEKEREQYACDICYVANASDYKEIVDKYKAYFPEEIQKDFQMVMDVYFQLMEDGTFFYGYEDNLNALGYIVKELHMEWTPKIIMKTAEIVADMLSYSRYKSLIVEWLLEAGFTNIKLYGNGWENNEKFLPYAMGPIENGEQLSKALQAAKIALGAHLSLSLPGRISEITASGAFCFVNDIPKADLGNAREYFEEDVELVYFYNKQDLIEKMEYYLTHEAERKKIAEAGRQKLQKEFTYEHILERLFGEIDQLLEKRGV